MSPTTNPVGKRCVGAQTTVDKNVIPEQQEEEQQQEEEATNKVRHLTGPLADSPDEGYVGDSQDGSDIWHTSDIGDQTLKPITDTSKQVKNCVHELSNMTNDDSVAL